MSAVEAALAEDNSELVMRRRSVARANTWEARYYQIISYIEAADRNPADVNPS
jgi:hypothetical protein